MNTINKNILVELLKDVEFWEAIKEEKMIVGYKLKLNHVYRQLRLAREALFYDDVYFPRTQRIMRLIKFMNIVPENVGWQEMEVGMNVNYTIWYPCEIEWQEFISDRFHSYFENFWYGDWSYEEPTEEELLSLGIRPESTVAIQTKLF